ncbi:hypothetical protein ACS0X5_21970 [Burkholderia gladioli]|uniref:hypothetical protein n=1 Tax=Burkholderia gladioli TaxID=28095 RepID=UPI003B97E0C2
MSKRKHAKSAHPQRRNFPNDYTREDLIAQLVAMGAECYRQAEQIEALTQRIYELEAEGSLLREGEQSEVDGEIDANGYRRCASDFFDRFDSIGLAERDGYSRVTGRGNGIESASNGDFDSALAMSSAEFHPGGSVPAPVYWPLADSAPRPVFRVFDVSM